MLQVHVGWANSSEANTKKWAEVAKNLDRFKEELSGAKIRKHITNVVFKRSRDCFRSWVTETKKAEMQAATSGSRKRPRSARSGDGLNEDGEPEPRSVAHAEDVETATRAMMEADDVDGGAVVDEEDRQRRTDDLGTVLASIETYCATSGELRRFLATDPNSMLPCLESEFGFATEHLLPLKAVCAAHLPLCVHDTASPQLLVAADVLPATRTEALATELEAAADLSSREVLATVLAAKRDDVRRGRPAASAAATPSASPSGTPAAETRTPSSSRRKRARPVVPLSASPQRLRAAAAATRLSASVELLDSSPEVQAERIRAKATTLLQPFADVEYSVSAVQRLRDAAPDKLKAARDVLRGTLKLHAIPTQYLRADASSREEVVMLVDTRFAGRDEEAMRIVAAAATLETQDALSRFDLILARLRGTVEVEPAGDLADLLDAEDTDAASQRINAEELTDIPEDALAALRSAGALTDM